MKKIYSFILLFVFTLFLTSCGSKMVNEIYNVTFEGTIDVEGFEDLTQSVIKSTESSIVTVLNYDVMFGGLDSNGTGSGVVYQSTHTTRKAFKRQRKRQHPKKCCRLFCICFFSWIYRSWLRFSFRLDSYSQNR